MQIQQSPDSPTDPTVNPSAGPVQDAAIHSGDLVVVRRQRWRVVDVRLYEKCRLITMTGAGTANVGVTRCFLLPFDAIGQLQTPTAVRFVSLRRWRSACRALIAEQAPPGGLRVAARVRMDLLPHQLEPALAIVRGNGSRVLLADDVGLGKTVQAGLIVAELSARRLAERVLVLAPAGLREQWAGELAHRFSIDAAIVDFRDIRRRVARLPIGLNPWGTVPVVVASIDYVKRPEVLASAGQYRWDVLVVDEAHGTASDSDRHAAVASLAARAGYVVLLTATPHSGDREAFESLCGTGQHGDCLLVFRRSRSELKLGARRRVHRLEIRTSPAESRMHALLHEFTRTVAAERSTDSVWLAASVLHKRALSSAQSLARSVERRLATIGLDSEEADPQLALPLEDPDGELDALDAPPDWPADFGLRDRERERSLLLTLAMAAAAAARQETKLAAVERLLRRIAEPVIIFTEYRDTLVQIRDVLARPVSVLHGGLSREERRTALDDFVCGRSPILLATDTAGEGLNLQERCRVVINLELPWNPMRLEQRIGRVDRIGQRRTIHVFHLIARDSGEEDILDRLQARIARARRDIPVPDPLADEFGAARSVEREAVERSEAVPPFLEPLDDPAEGRRVIDLAFEAAEEVGRLAHLRRLTIGDDEAARASLESAGTWVARARHHQTRCRLGHRAIALLRVEYEDGHGRISDSRLVPVAIHFVNGKVLAGPLAVRAMLSAAGYALRTHAEEAARREQTRTNHLETALLDVRLARELSIRRAVGQVRLAPSQPGLFDRRAEREHLQGRATLEGMVREIERQIQILDHARTRVMRPARLLLVLMP